MKKDKPTGKKATAPKVAKMPVNAAKKASAKRAPAAAKKPAAKASTKQKVTAAPAKAERKAAPAEAPKTTTRLRLRLSALGRNCRLQWQKVEATPNGETKVNIADYRVQMDALWRCQDVVRKAFEAFATSFVDEHPENKVQDDLELLAAAGRDLYETLLTPTDAEDAPDFRRWFESEVVCIDKPQGNPSYVVEMIFDPSSVSWLPPIGLAFTPRRGRQRPSSIDDFESYTDFWCIGLRSSCMTAVQLDNPLDLPINGNAFDIVIVREKRDKVYSAVETEVRRKHKHFGLSERQTYVSGELTQKLSDAFDQQAVLFHFDLEATTPGAFRLPGQEDDEDEASWHFTSEQLAQILQDAKGISITRRTSNTVRTFEEPAPKYALAIVDREAIIRGDRDPGWIKVFFQMPWIGVIAVEGDVKSQRQNWDDLKRVRHDRFLGLAFLSAILTQRAGRLIDSIVEARRQTWPFSMFFGVYCNTQQPWIKDRLALVDDLAHVASGLGDSHPASKSFARNTTNRT
jgi:hypothetical protein